MPELGACWLETQGSDLNVRSSCRFMAGVVEWYLYYRVNHLALNVRKTKRTLKEKGNS